MAPGSTVGRHALSTRFTANVRIHYIDYPSKQELASVYCEYTAALLIVRCACPKARALELAQKVAALLVDLYRTVKQKFSEDEQRHYLFTPKALTRIVFGLIRYDLTSVGAASGGSVDALAEALYNEIARSFRDRLTTLEGKQRFDSLLNALLKNYFSA
jgi:dynein heavy chain 2